METYAGFWDRVKAFAIDYAIILCYIFAITLLFFLSNLLLGASQWLFAERVRAQLTGFLFLTLPVILYFAISESSKRRATWGKRKVGLQVTNHEGNRIRVGTSFARTALKFIPWELSHTLIWNIYFYGGADSLWINYGFILVYGLIGLNLARLIFTQKHQTIYDLLARTYVTKQQ